MIEIYRADNVAYDELFKAFIGSKKPYNTYKYKTGVVVLGYKEAVIVKFKDNDIIFTKEDKDTAFIEARQPERLQARLEQAPLDRWF